MDAKKTPLWQPDKNTIKHSHLFAFINAVRLKQGVMIADYAQLYQWSIEQPELFWKNVSDFCNIQYSKKPTRIIQSHEKIWKTKWFVDATLNFAENCLWRNDDHIALIYANECNERANMTYQELRLKVFALTEKLKSLGLKSGDRVAGFVTNRIETVIAMLASTMLGAIWTACGPEFGANALIERFSQIEPVILFYVKEHRFGGKKIPLNETIEKLKKNLPSLKHTIDITHTHIHTHIHTPTHIHTHIHTPTRIHTPTHFPFDHPLYILYSSGTTGKPKCMVHGAGNVLIQHKKELMLHTDLHSDDILFFYTTCSWMMWHWMISGLSIGATMVLYDGSPFYPSNIALFDLIDEYDISIFGCGAKIIETYLKNSVVPKKSHQLKKLKTMLTTGSPLLKESFEYIYRDVKNTLRVSSISGGSDIVSCFALGNPLLPVYAEELQCLGLGMCVEIFDDHGNSIINKEGELVCTQPFPSMPLYFWNDAKDEKYFHAYFNHFPNVWTHGDYAKITEHNGLIIFGRSDATLNPGGVRIGTADIYEQVLKLDFILDCLAAGKKSNHDEHIILFVKLKNHMLLDDHLITKIKKIIRDNTSPFHVPKKIIQVSDIPKTMNGKTMEIAVKNIINGKEVENTESLANPECLREFKTTLSTD